MKTAFLILCFQVAVGDFQQVVHPPDAGLECYKCHKYDPNHPEDTCHVHHCHDDEFCEVDMEPDHTVDGKCKHRNEIYQCLLDMNPLCINYNSLVFFGKCRVCCEDANCVNLALNISGVPPVLTLPPTIPGTPDCVDLNPNCATTVNVCSSTNATTLCKRFCNLCGGLPPVVVPPDAGLECYNCHKYDPNHPEHLCHVHHCHDDEFCQVDIGLDNIVAGKCKHLNEFSHCLTDPQALCNYNALLYGGCRFCCQDADCVNKALNVSGGLPPVVTSPDAGLECYNCHKYDLNHPEHLCHVHHCHNDEFCQVDIGLDDIVAGKCKHLNEFSHCLTDPQPLCNYNALLYGGCRFCCQDADCVNKVLNVSGALSSPTTQITTTTTTTTSTTTTEKVTPISSLPICTSTTREDNCPSVPNVCSDRVAPYFCPEFCGLCTRQGKGTTPTDGTSKYSSATTVAPTTPSTTNPVTLGSSTCSDHSPVCSSTADICQRKFGLQLCEKTCRTCVSDNQTTGTTHATTITPMSTKAVSSPTTTATTSTNTLTTTTSTPTSSTSTAYSSTTTTVTSTVTTTKAPPAVHRRCYQCGSVDDGTYCTIQDIYIPNTSFCPAGASFCMTDIEQHVDGTTNYIRRCVNKQQCEKLWYQQTSDISECVDMDPTSLMSATTCRYCCTTDNCNGGKIPATQDLYRPKN